MADFTELPVDEGVGDWHFNRFRMVFDPPRGTSAVTLANTLLANFPTYINSDYATAKWSDIKYDGRKTVHFHGYAKYIGIDVGAPHTDWVAIVLVDPRTQGFTVQTLKREFGDATEDIEAGVGGGVVGGIVGGLVAIHYNRMHFLAGRRAWRIDNGSVFGLSNSVMVLETVAVERFSAEAFRIADSVIGLEKRLPDVWLAFLNNFVRLNGLKPVDQALKPSWKKAFQAMYLVVSYDGMSGLAGDPEFLGVNGVGQLYPAIVP